ncbi:MAG: site-specific integrase [Bacteroides sp.]|nr:site-specific integrase [Eubacterium sp.]MCM1419385.1 site-specific integrase [Roseburia sp.]MCM1463207.1 site-specific integrase [Bacteroides sp.]
MICKNCAGEIPERSLYCMHCGAALLHKKEKEKTAVKRRGNGQGSVYKLPNGKWACERTWYIAGSRKTVRKKGFLTRKEATEYIASLAPERKRSITVAEAYAALQPTFAKLSEKRQKTYQAAYKHLRDVETIPLETFSLVDLQSVIDDVDGGFYSKRYVKDLLNKIFTYAFIDGKLERNVVPYIVLPENVPQKETAVFTREEIALLWTLWGRGARFAGYLLTLIYCGLRTGELWSIRCESVSFDDHVMFGGIKTAKGKAAPIFMIEKIEPVIRALVSASRTTLYPGNATAFYREWQEFKREYHLRPELQPYSARHTCATLLSDAGLPEAVIMDITRHTSYDTTLKYTHIDTASVLRNMESALGAV